MVLVGLDGPAPRAVGRVVAQQMREGGQRCGIVDGDDLDAPVGALDDGAQQRASDAAQPVDSDAGVHGLSWEPRAG